MSSNLSQINWFPGHMKKAADEIREQMSKVDLVLEVVDARGVRVTSNPELMQIVNQKPVLRIALKADLSDLNEHKKDNLIIGSIKNKQFREVIIKEMYQIFQPKIDKLKIKGLINYNFIVMVVGIPNIGKSSLINFLANKNVMRVENRAGVTKNQNTKRINEHFFLIDTPGVLIKKIETTEDAYQLALLNNIKKEILPMEDVVKYGINYLNESYHSKLEKYFQTSIYNFNDFMLFICEKHGFKLKAGHHDFDRAYAWLFGLISNSEIMKFHFL